MERGYGQYCPIALASEVLAERWTPLVIRNLMLDCHRFSEILEGCPRMSTTLLSKRLRTLERDGVIVSVGAPVGRGRRYYLTASGQELAEVVIQLGAWGRKWCEVTPREQEPYIALWSWARMIDVDALPPRRVVARFDFRDRPRERFWMVLQRPRPEVCLTHPGGNDDLVVCTDVATLVDIQRGRRRLTDAIAKEAFTLVGDPILVRALPTWGGISPPLCLPVGEQP
jgi:DNA-binding HxlR family transcriptional regulator